MATVYEQLSSAPDIRPTRLREYSMSTDSGPGEITGQYLRRLGHRNAVFWNENRILARDVSEQESEGVFTRQNEDQGRVRSVGEIGLSNGHLQSGRPRRGERESVLLDLSFARRNFEPFQSAVHDLDAASRLTALPCHSDC